MTLKLRLNYSTHDSAIQMTAQNTRSSRTVPEGCDLIKFALLKISYTKDAKDSRTGSYVNRQLFGSRVKVYDPVLTAIIRLMVWMFLAVLFGSLIFLISG